MVHSVKNSEPCLASRSGRPAKSWEEFNVDVKLRYLVPPNGVVEKQVPISSTYHTTVGETKSVGKLCQFIMRELHPHTMRQVQYMELLDLVLPGDIVKIKIFETVLEWHQLGESPPLGHYTWRQGKMEKNRMPELAVHLFTPVIIVYLASEKVIRLPAAIPRFQMPPTIIAQPDPPRNRNISGDDSYLFGGETFI